MAYAVRLNILCIPSSLLTKKVVPMTVFQEEIRLDDALGTYVIARRTTTGWHLKLESSHGARAEVKPLVLQDMNGQAQSGQWTQVRSTDTGLSATGEVEHATGNAQFTLHLKFDTDADQFRPLALDWQVHFNGIFEGAILATTDLYELALAPRHLDLPSLHYGRVSYGTGAFPHPDPRVGFAFRADRMAQPAVHYSASTATWSMFTPSETPVPAVPEQVYALGVKPGEAADLLHVFVRYPQHEYGHRGDGSREAYVAKDTFAPGEERSATFPSNHTLHMSMFLLCRPPTAAFDSAAIMRFLWQRNAPEQSVPTAETLLMQAGKHIQWFNRRLYNPHIGGGQYESPEGSGTAMLGFVEQSLLMASTTLRYVALLPDSIVEPPVEERRQLYNQAASALTRWATEGRSTEGLLYPACDHTGYRLGYRNYADYDNLTIVAEDVFDTIRLATEARGLLAAVAIERFTQQSHQPHTEIWEDAALSVARWLYNHRLPQGGYAARYHRDGNPVDAYPAGTAAVLSLFCDCARLLAEREPSESQAYIQRAKDAYAHGLADLMAAGVFAGGTLDASCPDREAAIAALDACITLYELTDEADYLRDARSAADNILSYTMVYPITTFGPDTDAVRQGISTFGATIVSPENQHLDPVSTAPALLLYGLYTGDDIAVEAAIAAVKWTLDGRWAIAEPQGLKQSEQLLHTRWYYNTFFSQRGNFRRGMPLWGRSDSEHGWPQVVPSAAFLATGQVVVDWRTGRAAAVDGWKLEDASKHTDEKLVLRLSPPSSTVEHGHEVLLLKVVRLPESPTIHVVFNNQKTTLSSAQLAHGHIFTSLSSGTIELVINKP